jgi:tetratricopeptide (TPR) repeat protein
VAADAEELHRRAVLDGDRGLYGSARRLLRTGLNREPGPVLRAHILVSLAYYEAERTGLGDGLQLLVEAEAVPGLPDRILGLVASQRGLLNQRAGLPTESLAAFDIALQLLGNSDSEDRGRALLNRGIVHLNRGDRGRAGADFSACRDLAERLGLGLMAAKAAHNLGYLWLLAGDLPRALREMDAVASQLGGQSHMFAAVYYGDRALVLLAVGLFTEADSDLERAAELFHRAGVPGEWATAQLSRARVALHQERWPAARRFAVRARRQFNNQGSPAWPLIADELRLAADVGSGSRLRAAVTGAQDLQRRLAALGLPDQARSAALTGAAAALRLGDTNLAREVAGSATRLHRDDSLRMRLQARTVRIDLADREGRGNAVGSELRDALRDVHRHQASFGSLDLQAAVGAYGRPLAALALRRALAGGDPATVFTWTERGRALSMRLPPVVPPADPTAAALLEELREAHLRLRATDPDGPPARDLRTRCRRLERQIRQRSWHAPGPGEFDEPVRLRSVRAHLAEAGATLVTHLRSDSDLFALVVRPNSQTLLALGDADPVLELHQRLRADLDTLAVLRPGRIRDGVTRAYLATLHRLDALLWSPLDAVRDDGPLLLAPSSELAALPWPLLSSLRSRPITVVSSVSAWVGARDRSAHCRIPGQPPVVVAAAGPGLARAQDEIAAVAAIWPGAAQLPAATADDVLRAATTADVLHIASHGSHARGNALFSRLDLHGGALFGHELQQLPSLPTHVVLSACDLGQVDTRYGGEALGMAASMLHSGTASVMAGVARVNDETSCRIAIAHHEQLRQGATPAAALAAAIAQVPETEPAPFVCFGAGW